MEPPPRLPHTTAATRRLRKQCCQFGRTDSKSLAGRLGELAVAYIRIRVRTGTAGLHRDKNARKPDNNVPVNNSVAVPYPAGAGKSFQLFSDVCQLCRGLGFQFSISLLRYCF